ncbi:hypothetical protein BJ085DRAFT_5380, partial [Dimargaris cristalligena]
GVIDADFHGEIQVLIHNLMAEPLHFRTGNHIVQLIFQQCESPLLLEMATLNKIKHSITGFGST